MLRKLLACLALLTGLAAAGVPAQAEVAVALASRVEASTSVDTAHCDKAEMSSASFREGAHAAVCAVAAPTAGPVAAGMPVRIGSDRARE